MVDEAEARAADAALDAERRFVISLGGFALEIPGATLVTHEKIPVPRFNFVLEHGVGAERQAAFFERALDHYFQRAIRPAFRVPEPVAGYLDSGLHRLGFRARDEPLALLLNESDPPDGASEDLAVGPAGPGELDEVASFWTGERERPELRTAIDIVVNHPNPRERLVPILARRGRDAVAAALVYRYGESAGIHAVATRPASRGQGAATALVRFVLTSFPSGPGVRYSIFADSDRLERRLVALGFRRARTFREYELPPSADLAVPPPGVPGPPRWRPPRAPARPAADR